MNARSHVGASGLMQVMPARWTARKLGMNGFSADQLSDRDINIAIGTGYLKLVLDDWRLSLPAAAAYNAGPSRSRAWRNGPVLEGAAWAESVAFQDARLRQEGAGQHHLLRRDAHRAAAVAEGAPGHGGPARRGPAGARRGPALMR